MIGQERGVGSMLGVEVGEEAVPSSQLAVVEVVIERRMGVTEEEEDVADSPNPFEARPVVGVEVWVEEESRESGVQAAPPEAGEVSGGESGTTEVRCGVGVCGIVCGCHHVARRRRRRKRMNNDVQSVASRYHPSCSPVAVTCILRHHGNWNGWGYPACRTNRE